MASKPKAPTRTTRIRTPTIPIPAPSRTTRAANTRATPTPPLTDPHAKKVPTRRAFADRNVPVKARVGDGKQVKSSVTKPVANTYTPSDVDKEPIRAYLRIRPQIGDEDDTAPHTNPYLLNRIYTFSHVFPPDTSQSDFFEHTTLPLVKDVLEGQSGLLFAYGVTNSGKTYTVQGDSQEGSAGIISRSLDVIFNSIEGLHGDGRFRPVRLQGIEASPPTLSSSRSSISSLLHEPVLLHLPPTHPDTTDTDPTAFKLDRNHEYTIWLSYAEVYNEKVYDLLASVDSGDDRASRPTSTFLTTPLNPSSHSKQQQPLLLTRKALPVKPSPPSDSSFSFSDDSDSPISGGKYVAGQRQIRVTSAAQAKALLRVGQMHRQVFGTLANARSSRSHAVVTVKDPTSIQTSRLTLVDLAGSERTQTTGDRLREAGNINKSLMVLGQCMGTMRANQRSISRRDARGLGFNGEDGGRYDTREAKKSLAVVPFKHSKLTEVLMDYFVGEGRVVMIVNVNPYDTGYDENSHVMKVSAIAHEVATLPPTATSRPVSTIPRSKSSIGAGSTRGSDGAGGGGVVPHRRKVTISTGGPGVGETTLEVLEEDEEPGLEDEDDEPINPLVDALFDEIETLRMQLYESEMRSVIIEAQTREEVMTEMEERMKRMEGVYSRRLMQEIEQYEMKMDAKIEMLQRAGAGLASNPPPRISLAEDSDETEEDDIEEDVTEDEDDQPIMSVFLHDICWGSRHQLGHNGRNLAQRV
ncbi:P-loop containing nucleoside triphosphate hydrolase protein [Irpex lacteus]|nr:P-loop containing nucleoside triphosphate hydrolase protein [Irpex lacteus]